MTGCAVDIDGPVKQRLHRNEELDRGPHRSVGTRPSDRAGRTGFQLSGEMSREFSPGGLHPKRSSKRGSPGFQTAGEEDSKLRCCHFSVWPCAAMFLTWSGCSMRISGSASTKMTTIA